MKKICVIFMLLVIMLVAVGCSNDVDHASITITTSDGQASTYYSHSRRNDSWPTGQHLANVNKATLEVPEGGSVQYTFKCDTCGYEVSEELAVPTAKELHCECDGEAEWTEYFCFNAVYPQTEK